MEVAAALDSRYCSATGQDRAGGLKREGEGEREGGRGGGGRGWGGNGREVTSSWRRRPIERGGKGGDREWCTMVTWTMVQHGDVGEGRVRERREGKEGREGEGG